MSRSIRLCGVKHSYLDYLRQFDHKVSYDPTHSRKFVGILFHIDEHSYYAPLSSPKPKHQFISSNAPDIYKIKNGKLGIINFNNMLPIVNTAIVNVEIDKVPNIKYKQLLINQMIEIRKNQEYIKKKAVRLYQIVASGKHPTLYARCCNFQLLEEMSLNFIRISSETIQETAVADQFELE